MSVFPQATLWYPSPDPVGEPSIWALIVAAVAIGVVCGSAKRHPRFSAVLEWVGPLVMPVLAAPYLCTRFRDGAGLAAAAVYLSVGFGFALANLRKPSLLQRWNGLVLTFGHGSFIFGWLAASLATLYPSSLDRYAGAEAFWSGVIVFCALWAVVVVYVILMACPSSVGKAGRFRERAVRSGPSIP